MNDEKLAELLMDHYKDTFEQILFHWKARNRLFLFILFVVCVMAIDSTKPGSVANVANAYLAKTLTVEAKSAGEAQTTIPTLDFSAVGILCWFVLLCLMIQYYQRSIQVDRQYNYIANLEEHLCTLLGDDFVTREGRAYRSTTGIYNKSQLAKRPLFLEAVGPLYLWVFPISLCGFVILKAWLAGWQPGDLTFWINIGLEFAIILYSVFYMRWVAYRK
jgi:hypothetical protein